MIWNIKKWKEEIVHEVMQEAITEISEEVLMDVSLLTPTSNPNPNPNPDLRFLGMRATSAGWRRRKSIMRERSLTLTLTLTLIGGEERVS